MRNQNVRKEIKQEVISMRKLLKKSMAAVLTASMVMSMTACAGKAVKPGSEESEAKTSEAAAANVETSEVAGEEGLTTEDITLTISWWGGESRHEATQKAIEAFMKKYPNIKVESSFGGWTGWESKMGLAFSQGKADDIVQTVLAYYVWRRWRSFLRLKSAVRLSGFEPV